MDKHGIIKAIDEVVNGLQKLKIALLTETIGGEQPKTSTQEAQEVSPAIELLASKLAYAYSTRHPEYEVAKLFEDLKNMVEGDKISYIIAWMRKGNTEGIEGFLKLDRTQQRTLLQKALSTKEQEIKDIFTKRFLHDS